MAEWTYQVSLAVPNDDETRLLLMPEGERWTLPRFTLQALYTDLYILTRAIHDQMGADMIILRTLARQKDEEAHVSQVVWMMDNRTVDWTLPEGARWIDRAGLDAVTLADEWMRPALEQALDTLKDVSPAARPPWFQKGWFSQAEQWMSAVLTVEGYTLLRPPEHFKHGTISSVLRAETTAGNVFFKVALPLPLFGNEPQLSTALGQLYPDTILAPLAIDAARRWMLTADIGTQLRSGDPSPALLEKVVKTFARLQIDSASHIDTLFAAGCLDRRLDVLLGQIDDLLADEACYGPLNAEERAEWQACGDQLKRLCQRLTDYNLPYTLVHGDFHGGNIALQGERIRFFDWTDACVTHPFFDLPVLIDFDEQESGAALRDAYLAEWTAYEPLERLREAYAIVSILGALHQAVSYRGIINGVEADQRAEWAFGVPFFARQIIQQLKVQKEI